MANTGAIGTEQVAPTTSGLEVLTQYPEMHPEDEFHLAYFEFKIKYHDLRVEKMPDEAYEDYMYMEGLYAKSIPSSLLKNNINISRDVMQRYAECHGDLPEIIDSTKYKIEVAPKTK